MAVDRISILPPPPNPHSLFFPTHNSFFNTSDSYQFKNHRVFNVQYRIIFSFDLTKRMITLIRAETERYDIVRFSKVATKSLALETGPKESNELGERTITGEL